MCQNIFTNCCCHPRELVSSAMCLASPQLPTKHAERRENINHAILKSQWFQWLPVGVRIINSTSNICESVENPREPFTNFIPHCGHILQVEVLLETITNMSHSTEYTIPNRESKSGHHLRNSEVGDFENANICCYGNLSEFAQYCSRTSKHVSVG